MKFWDGGSSVNKILHGLGCKGWFLRSYFRLNSWWMKHIEYLNTKQKNHNPEYTSTLSIQQTMIKSENVVKVSQENYCQSKSHFWWDEGFMMNLHLTTIFISQRGRFSKFLISDNVSSFASVGHTFLFFQGSMQINRSLLNTFSWLLSGHS